MAYLHRAARVEDRRCYSLDRGGKRGADSRPRPFFSEPCSTSFLRGLKLYGRSACCIMATMAAPPTPILHERVVGEDHGDDIYDDDYSCSDYSFSYSEESDDELDWDPDRERLLRCIRQSSASGTAASASSGSSSSTAVAGATPAQLDRQKSLAERRNEWRAARGLSRQKTVRELIEERRAAREEAARESMRACSTAAPSAAVVAAATAEDAAPLSDNRGLEHAERALSIGQDGGVPGSSSGVSNDGDSSRVRTKKKGTWPWRTR